MVTREELKEAQYTEALLRMRKIGFHPNVLKEFKEERKLNKSLTCKLGRAYIGKLVWLSEEEKDFIKEFEEEYNCTVYHVIESDTMCGKLLSIFYVSSHIDEWEMDNELINSKSQFVYVKNVDDSICSEFGYIEYQNALGGLIRTA